MKGLFVEERPEHAYRAFKFARRAATEAIQQGFESGVTMWWLTAHELIELDANCARQPGGNEHGWHRCADLDPTDELVGHIGALCELALGEVHGLPRGANPLAKSPPKRLLIACAHAPNRKRTLRRAVEV